MGIKLQNEHSIASSMNSLEIKQFSVTSPAHTISLFKTSFSFVEQLGDPFKQVSISTELNELICQETKKLIGLAKANGLDDFAEQEQVALYTTKGVLLIEKYENQMIVSPWTSCPDLDTLAYCIAQTQHNEDDWEKPWAINSCVFIDTLINTQSYGEHSKHSLAKKKNNPYHTLLTNSKQIGMLYSKQDGPKDLKTMIGKEFSGKDGNPFALYFHNGERFLFKRYENYIPDIDSEIYLDNGLSFIIKQIEHKKFVEAEYIDNNSKSSHPSFEQHISIGVDSKEFSYDTWKKYQEHLFEKH